MENIVKVIHVTFLINGHTYEGYADRTFLNIITNVNKQEPKDIELISGLTGITNKTGSLNMDYVKNTFVCGWREAEISL